MPNTDHEIDPRDLLITPADYIEEAEAYEYEVACLLDGTREAPPWTNKSLFLAYNIEQASHCRQRAAELS